MSDQPNPEQPASQPETPAPKVTKISFITKIKELIKRHPRRAMAVGVVVVAAIIGIGLTDAKYAVLGLVVKTKVEATVVDSETQTPVSGATVQVGSVTGTTDGNGHVSLLGVTPGNQKVEVFKQAYQTVTEDQKLGFGDNQLGDIQMQLTGIRLSFVVTDKVSGQPLADAKISVGNASSSTDAKGAATVSAEDTGAGNATATISDGSYLDLKLTVALKRGQKPFAVGLTPAGKVYYLTNRNTRIDLMQSNLDGSGERLVLAGTGSEDTQTGILPDISSPDLIALVSSRAGHQDQFGDPKHDLYLVNGATGKLTLIEQDVAFDNFRGWVGNILVYETFRQSGDSTISAIKAFDATTGKVSTLAQPGTNASVSVELVGNGKVYYSVNNGTSAQNGLYVIAADGSGRVRLSPVAVDNIVSQSKTALIYRNYQSTPVLWRKLNLTNDQVTSLSSGPSNQEIYGYADSPSGKYSAFIDVRDGRSELYTVNADDSGERRVTNGAKVNEFVQWYGDKYIVFSTTTDENALYVVALSGGKPVKITDFFKGNGRTYGGGGYNPYY